MERIIAMLPADTAGLPMQHALPKASIKHTLRRCDQCDRLCWIGPAQLRERKRGGRALCYWCLVPLMRDADMQLIALDPHADDVPRRT